jgi:AraC-like DNA-binding protein
LKNKYPEKDWFTIAVHSGYYDYQHLSKVYKEFTGFTPTEFFKIESHSPERLFGDVEM